jgi:hypothetical protein
MKLRPFITLLLTITLLINATAQAARNRTDDPPADKEEEKITAQEEQEARELVAQLTTRWQETEDIGPLVEEFYVSDFAERLRHEPQLFYFTELKEELLTQATPPELRRHYVAMTNFVHLVFRLYTVYESTRTKDDEQELDLKRIIPVNILNVFESNPNLKALMDEETGDQAEGQTGQEAQEQATGKGIKNIEQLHLLTNALEQAVVLLRDHVRTLPATLSAREIVRARRSEEGSSAEEEDDPLKPHSYTLSEEFYGYPAGTRLICVDLLPLHMDLVRVGQRLKVVSIYMQGD